MSKFWKSAFAAMVLIGAGGAAPLERLSYAPILPALGGNLSVLTYNVEGLPWPAASGRPANLGLIGDRLRDLRMHGQAPHIVVLQEAFTNTARAIGHAAGYRFVIEGPSAGRAQGAPATDAHWWNGETEGKFVGSGLQILSDYPVVAVRRMSFPVTDCAGYDCLANKGALFVRIALPGVATPIDVVTTHLNSRTASGVAIARADRAYAAQVGLLADFVARSRDPRDPLIVAGDFNTGKTRFRRETLSDSIAKLWGPRGAFRDALGDATRRGFVLNGDAAHSWHCGKDWQFFAPGHAADIDLTGISVPFGHDPDGLMLSDHVGYIAYFKIAPR